jgi:biotin carboxylase
VFVGRHGLPVIVKPAALSASIGVSRVDSLADVDRAWAKVRALGVDRVLVEEYLAGAEISVESISFGRGDHHVVAVTAKSTLDNFVEVGHVVPARLRADETDEVRALTVALLNAVGHTDGPAHTEMRLTDAGPRIVESHNRQGGDHITDLVDLVYGVDLIRTSIAWATGRTDAWATTPTGQGAAAVRFLTPPPGQAAAITGVDEVRAWDGVVAVNLAVSPGDEIREVRSSHERAGCVIVQAPDTAAATHLATRAANGIRFATEQPDEPDVRAAVPRAGGPAALPAEVFRS